VCSFVSTYDVVFIKSLSEPTCFFRGHFIIIYGSSSAHASQAAQIDSALNMVELVVVVVVGHDLVNT
jgi:hypothetical protein